MFVYSLICCPVGVVREKGDLNNLKFQLSKENIMKWIVFLYYK